MLPSNELFGYDPCAKSWTRVSISNGDVPPTTSGASGSVIRGFLSDIHITFCHTESTK